MRSSDGSNQQRKYRKHLKAKSIIERNEVNLNTSCCSSLILKWLISASHLCGINHKRPWFINDFLPDRTTPQSPKTQHLLPHIIHCPTPWTRYSPFFIQFSTLIIWKYFIFTVSSYTSEEHQKVAHVKLYFLYKSQWSTADGCTM